MSEINYQALREVAERAIPAMERLLMLPADDDLLSEQELKDYGVDIDALNAFKFLAGPETVLALLDEREAKDKVLSAQDNHINQQADRIESLEKKNGEQGRALEAAEKRIAELEKIATDYALKFQKAQDALKYAALSHSRTAQQTNNLAVSLPERSSMLHRTDFHEDYQTVMAYKVSEVIAAIRAAGIRIKGE